ncbi:MAG: YIP1 family protein [Vampirovibrionia bacterium]|nr:hypothetical protein [Cyanobacteria bacterium REEB446]
MSSVSSNIYNLIFKPSTAFKYFDLKFNRSLFFQSLIVCFLAAASSTFLSLGESLDIIFQIVGSATLIFLIGFIFTLKRNDFFKLICFLCFANLPLIFKAPLTLISYKLPFLGFTLSFLLSLWVFNLTLIATATICKISKARALLLLLIPTILLVIIIFILVVKLVLPALGMFI